MVQAGDQLGLDLIRAGGPDNVVTSPASAQLALSMAAEGADGQTLAELEALLGAQGQSRTDAFNALSMALAAFDGDAALVQGEELPDTPLVHVANHVVVDAGFTVQPTYLERLAAGYGAGADTVDLDGDDGKALLDAWVNEHTGGLIEESAIKPAPTLKLVLQNAVVLAARWELPFPAVATQKRPFTLADGSTVEVPMMTYGAVHSGPYAELDGWQAVRLPYTGGRLYADIMLPPSGVDPGEATPDLLAELGAQLEGGAPRGMYLTVPLVDTRSTADLLGYLQEHAPAALVGGFDGIAGGLFIGQAAQQAVLVMDEEGTIAAAVTEVGFPSSGTDLDVTVNRPYLVRIADGQTGWALFLAKIADPSQ